MAIDLLAVVSILTDLLFGKIYNWTTLPAVVLGLLLSFILLGWQGGALALLSVLLALLLYGGLFWLGVMGAGDVKLLMALGAWGGVGFTFQVAVLGILCGGVYGLFLLLFRGQLLDFYLRVQQFLLALMLRDLEVQPLHLNPRRKMPFGVPLCIAAVLIVHFQPFHWMGWG